MGYCIKDRAQTQYTLYNAVQKRRDAPHESIESATSSLDFFTEIGLVSTALPCMIEISTRRFLVRLSSDTFGSRGSL